MARTVHKPNAAYFPEGIARLSNLIGRDVRNTLILFTAVVVRCCSIALHMPQYREFSTANYFVLVENEKTFYTISLDPGSVITGVFTKVVESHSDEER